MEDVYTCSTYKVITINHVTMEVTRRCTHFTYITEQIWLPHYTHVLLDCYCSAPIDPTLVHTQSKHFVSDTNSYKVMGINMKKKYVHQMQTNNCNN